MKWGRKKLSSKSSSSSSSRPSFISHMFPISWLSKFKQKSRDVEAKPVKVKREGKQNTACMKSPKSTDARGGRFYGGVDEAFWRLSFGQEGVEGKSSRGAVSSVWYDSREEFYVPPSTCQSCGSRATTLMGEEEIEKFNNLILDARIMRELPRGVEILPAMDTCRSGKEALTKTQKVMTEKERKLKKINPRLSKENRSKPKNEAEENPRNSIEKGNSGFEPLRTSRRMQRENCKLTITDLKKHHHVSPTRSKVSNFTTTEGEGVSAAQSLNRYYGTSSAEKMSSEWEELKQMKIRELKSKSENERKSLYISRELQGKRTKHNKKVKVSSPRIRALEDMKKAKLKMKKGKERTMEGRKGLESFAVVKCSFDPQKDFTDSMHEMIMEKKISQPEELEELLACYLTLNPDEYHDLIINVFQQVWFDLYQTCFDIELLKEKFHN